MLVFHMEHMKEGETMTVYEMAKEDEYIHHAYNINQRLYRLKQSKKIDCGQQENCYRQSTITARGITAATYHLLTFSIF